MVDNIQFAQEEEVAQPTTDLTVRNISSIGPMLWIGFYTVILNLLTLTVFRFWGRTHFRRRLWADTSVGGEPLTYTGRGLELFIGFIIAIFTVMAPFFGSLLLAQTLLGPEGAAAVIGIIYLVFFVLIGAAIFLSRRYHLSRTRYRGIRFAQTGSAIVYGLAYFGYGILASITLGWFGPEARIRLSRMMWENAYYGDLRFQFIDTPEAKAEPVYKSFALAWFGGIISIIAWFGLIAATTGLESFAEDAATDVTFILVIYASFIPIALLLSFFVSWHEAVMTRRILKSLHLGDVKVSSNLTAWDIFELSITNMLLIIFTLGFGYMAAQMRVWKRIANKMELNGSIDFETIGQSPADTPSQGEGLADGLDLVSNF